MYDDGYARPCMIDLEPELFRSIVETIDAAPTMDFEARKKIADEHLRKFCEELKNERQTKRDN